MDSVEVIDDEISEKSIALREEVSAITTSSFKMFGGELTTVTLQFYCLLDAEYDNFGEGIKIRRIRDYYVATIQPVQISPTFWAWVY